MTKVSQTEDTGASGKRKDQPGHSHRPQPAPYVFILALSSGLLLWASFYPLNWGWLGWVALAPLLGLVRARARPLRIYAAALLCGLTFFVPVLQWMRVADPRMYATWLALAIYCSLYFPAAIFFLRYLDQRTRLPLVITVPVVWTALEFLRAHLISGFPWYYLAHTQHEILALIQISDITGAYGLSALMAAGNAVVFEILLHWERFRLLSEPGRHPESPRLPIRFQFTAVLSTVCAVLVYGLFRMENARFESGPRVVLVQPNTPQQIRNEAANAGQNAARTVMAEYTELTDKALSDGPEPKLIVWPESSIPDLWMEPSAEAVKQLAGAAELARKSHEKAVELAKEWETDFLFGATVSQFDENKKEQRFNSAILINADGETVARYNKIHRVPFGEYVPFREYFKWMDRFSPYDFDYSVLPGTTLDRFKLGPWTFGVVICYEDTDPTLARQYVRAGDEGQPVDFLVNISNDGWFDGTSEHEQHLATCRFRAIEARRSIARSVNMGISAVVDGNGRTVALPGGTIPGSKKMAGFLVCDVPIDRRESYYARFGDWFPWSCWIVLAGACLFGWTRSLTSSNPS